MRNGMQFVGRHPCWAAFFLGLLSALALPPLHVVPVLWLVVPLLLWLLAAAPSWWRAAWLGFLFGFGHHIAGLYWVTEAVLTEADQFWWLVPFAAPGVALIVAPFMILPALAAWWVVQLATKSPLPGTAGAAPGTTGPAISAPPRGLLCRLPGVSWPMVLAFAGAWTVQELLRGVLFTGFPWNPIGSVWAFSALPIQGAALVGVNGLSFITILIAALPVLGWRPWLGGAVALVALAGFGAWRLTGTPPALPEPPVAVVLVQGNVTQDLKWDQSQQAPIFNRYLDLTAQALDAAAKGAPPGAHLVAVWPETASPYLLAQDEVARQDAARVLPPDALLLAGTVRAVWGADGKLAQVYNSMVALDHSGQVLDVYDKAHLVPFGEYMPLDGWLPLRMVTGGMDFSAGPGRKLVSLPGVPPFSPLICYEIIFPGQVVPKTRPAWMVNITNDAWFGDSAGPWQHLAAARMRAVEEGLPVMRAAQTGVSAAFDSFGRCMAMLPVGEVGALTVVLPGALPPTFFSLWGQGIPWILAMVAILCAAGWAWRCRHARFR